jgi:spore coat protein H
MAHWWRDPPRTRRTHIAVLALLGAGILAVLLLAPGLAAPEPEPAPDTLLAFAYAMPDDGWAPLTVYLSPFGSRDLAGSIVRYEWDLDGDGSFETDATASGGYTQRLYTRPRTYNPTLRVTNALGKQATAATTVVVRHPASSSVDYGQIFDDTRVRRITLRFQRADWDRMMADPTLKIRVEGEAVVFGERLEKVEIGPRGNFTLRIAGEKIPWQIDTDAIIAGQEFHNLKQLLLTNNISDPAVIGEKLAYDLLELAGAPASHVAFVELYIDWVDDGQDPAYWGVYTLVERVDSKYIRNRFGTRADGGSLYKTNHFKQGAGDLIYYGPSFSYYPQPHGVPLYDQRNDDLPGDYADLIQFLWVLDGETYSTPEDWAAAVEAVFDMDGFLRWLAVQTAIMSWDIYPYTGNNYYLYHDPDADRWLWLPWDQTWGEGTTIPLFSLPGGEPRLLERAPLYERMLEVPRYRQALAAYLDLLVRTGFNEAAMAESVEQYCGLIAGSVRSGDPAYAAEGGMHTFEAFDDACQHYVELTRDRSQFIQDTLLGDPASYLIKPGMNP